MASKFRQKQWDVFRLDVHTDDKGKVCAAGWYVQAYSPDTGYEGDETGPFESKEAAMQYLHSQATVPSGPYTLLIRPT